MAALSEMPGVFELDVLETDEREDRDGEVVNPRPVD
jgi:hypothetical protein